MILKRLLAELPAFYILAKLGLQTSLLHSPTFNRKNSFVSDTLKGHKSSPGYTSFSFGITCSQSP
jgi:hypothetical protein